MSQFMLIRLIVGVVLIIVAFVLAGRRIKTLVEIMKAGQPIVGRPARGADVVDVEATEVLGQRKLLAWLVPGGAHALIFWGFLVLGLTIVETFGAIVWADFAIPVIGRSAALGFIEDLFVLFVLIALVAFAIIRLRNNPREEGRGSRFFGSHLGAAWLVLFLIFNVMWTLIAYRAAQYNVSAETGVLEFPYYESGGAWMTQAVASWLAPLGLTANEWLATICIVLNIGIVLGFLILVLHSKHLHIFLAPINVAFSRRPNALGPLLPMYSGRDRIDFEDPADDAVFGRGRIEDFTWKGLLDLATCTECGRCQSQCPAWNTEKPLSPKLMIMNLRDHMFAAAPYLQETASKGERDAMGERNAEALALVGATVANEVARPLVGERPPEHADTDGFDAEGHRSHDGPVINVDALWSCTMCGACVQQCPVDIEHVDHFVDMRRNLVMIESEFPHELAGLFKNVEQKGNPWGMGASMRNAWIEEVDFQVRVFGAGGEETIPADVEYLFWVGCAGAYEDRARQTTKDVAALLHTAGVEFMVLGEGETCTGDPARRAGNEFLFQMQAMQNVEVLNEIKARKIVVTCPHCLNTIGREYPQLGGNYEVVHHTQLLNQLVRDGKLKPLKPLDETVTYHDPCYLGRHNRIYSPPRDLVASIPGIDLVEMDRRLQKSFCCGAGGSRMWMEETLGSRINLNRTDEALATGADRIVVGCPFCNVMLTDGTTVRQQEGSAKASVKVVDVAGLLLDSVQE